MKEVTQQPRIDLAEIALIADALRHREDEMLPRGWKAMRVATALEALPKLVDMLKQLRGFCEEAVEEFNYPEANELIDYFTNQTEQP